MNDSTEISVSYFCKVTKTTGHTTTEATIFLHRTKPILGLSDCLEVQNHLINYAKKEFGRGDWKVSLINRL